MNTRKGLIYAYVVEQCRLNNNRSLTTKEISETLDLQRSNVSKDLNTLVREGKLAKTTGRPVKYFLEEEMLGRTQAEKPELEIVQTEEKETLKSDKMFGMNDQSDIFDDLIGSRNSLKNAVEQARAAILYPPKGLNCLITGPTGSGKTYFAHLMFQYAKENQVIQEEKELVVFNCADYAHNPQLLMSHLFGHVEGAFTGADQEKEGLMDQANGGILFLDEIHRLPPEGQEMIFYFMDHGVFNRLGEIGKNHQAEVRIIGATTETTSSALLDTFLRRIPIHIQLPSFEQRTPQEKIAFIQLMVSQEASRIKRRISLTEEVIKALIGSVTFGNIGQLKSSVQLVCARGFLNHMHREQIDLSVNDLPEGVRSGLDTLTSRRELSMGLANYLPKRLVVDSNQEPLNRYADQYELPYNLYDIIGDKAALLKSDGIDQEAINHFISTDINVHLQSFYRDHGFSFSTVSKLGEFVDEKVIEVTNLIYRHVETYISPENRQNFIYGMSLHIGAFLKKLAIGETRAINYNIQMMVADYPVEFKLAQEIHQMISDFFNIALPDDETYYLAALLISLRYNPTEGEVGVVVAAHGNSTASSMAAVARQLLGINQPLAVDMPLDMSPKIAYEKIKTMITQANRGSGVLLLVDMGSLANFNEKLSQETGIQLRTLDMVTTPIVLEAARKAETLGMTLDVLVDSLKEFTGYSTLQETLNEEVVVSEKSGSRLAILAICASGEGTAQHLKQMIKQALIENKIDSIEVLTESVVDIRRRLPEIQASYQLLAVTGILDPKIEVPFFSLERLLESDLGELLGDLLLGEDILDEDPKFSYQEQRQACLTYLEEAVTFLNPIKVLDPLWDLVEQLCAEWYPDKREEKVRINFVLHLANMMERILLGEPLVGTAIEEQVVKNHPKAQFLANTLTSIEESFRLKVPVTERYYLLMMLDNVLKNQVIH